MIFLSLSFLSIGATLGVILLVAINNEHDALIKIIDSRPLKTFALWLICANFPGLFSVFTRSIIVPRPTIIWYGLIYVWIESLVGVLTSNAGFLYLSDGDLSLQIGKTEDMLGVVLIFVHAALFSAWRVEQLTKVTTP